MNNVALMGRLTHDPELRETSSGTEVCNFDIAVKRPFSKDKTDFIKCTAWRNTAQFVSKYFSKGKMIAVTGSLIVDPYEDKEGNKRKDYKINVDNVEFCGGKTEDKKPDEPEPEPQETESTVYDDVPF